MNVFHASSNGARLNVMNVLNVFLLLSHARGRSKIEMSRGGKHSFVFSTFSQRGMK